MKLLLLGSLLLLISGCAEMNTLSEIVMYNTSASLNNSGKNVQIVDKMSAQDYIHYTEVGEKCDTCDFDSQGQYDAASGSFLNEKYDCAKINLRNSVGATGSGVIVINKQEKKPCLTCTPKFYSVEVCGTFYRIK